MQRQGSARHLVTPRVLLFLQRGERWLFIEGAARKWWAGRLNGIGGSVEADEGILEAARRECREETGLDAEGLRLAALIHVLSAPPVLLFAFLGALPEGDLADCDEGTFHWLRAEEAMSGALPLMADLPLLLPRLWALPEGAPPLLLTLRFAPDGTPHLTEG